MKNKFVTSIFTSLLLSSLPAIAHEGHGDLPGQLKSLHGGVVKAGKLMNMEMLVIGDTVQFFPQAHSGEDLKTADVQLQGSSKAPKKKADALSFASDGKSFTAKVDLKGSYRADLEIKAQYQGKTDSFKFLIEK